MTAKCVNTHPRTPPTTIGLSATISPSPLLHHWFWFHYSFFTLEVNSI